MEAAQVEEAGKPTGAATAPRRILCIDDEPLVGQLIAAALAAHSDGALAVTLARTAAEGLAAVERLRPDAVLLDVGLPDRNGLEVLERIKSSYPDIPVIVMTGLADVRTAVRAIQMGAYQFLTKPFNNEELMVILQRAMERSLLVAELEALRRRAGNSSAMVRLVGTSPATQVLLRQLRQVAPSNFTVLVQGETGVGKEVVTRALHEESARRDRPLVAIDCGALPETLLESELFGHEKGAFSGADRRKEGLFFMAEGGTLFLDEIGNMPLGLQAKLLRVLQERRALPVGATVPRVLDVRFVAATNVPLDQAVREGKFRQDLYYRLAEFVIAVPPLRERTDDIMPLSKWFMEQASIELHRPVRGFDDTAVRMLGTYEWPGNVRELRNVVRQAVLLAEDFQIRGSTISHLLGLGLGLGPAKGSRRPGESTEMETVAAHTPPPSELSPEPLSQPGTTSLREISERASAEAETAAITAALRRSAGNKTQAARFLQVDYKTLHLKMKRYGLTSTND